MSGTSVILVTEIIQHSITISSKYLYWFQHYYKNGAAYDITWKQACPLVSDIFYTMDDAIDALETMDGSEDDDG